MEILNLYFKVWYKTAASATQIAFSSRLGASLFLIGKIMRFGLLLGLILLIASQTKIIAGYTAWQMVFFYATFNFIDTLTQFLLREVYRFRSYVVSGDFDYFLVKPISPLFRSLFGGSDVLDLPMILLSLILLFVSAGHLNNIQPGGVFVYILLVASALVIALALHILVLSIGVLTTEVDNTIMLYRDLTGMGRFPVDIYREPISWLITFVLPVGIMMTYPAKALMGSLSLNGILISLFISITFLTLSLKFWQFSLKNYTSASS